MASVSESTLGSLGRDVLDALGRLAGDSQISSPLVVTGKSGVRHSFTLGASNAGGTALACDVVVGSSPADETKVLSLFIRVYDVAAKNAVLCAVPSASKEAKRLASQYKITVVEAQSREGIASALGGVLRQLLKP